MKFQGSIRKECNRMDKRPIGVMDSGLGGLSVARVLQERLPNESIIFVGDQGHFPYGTKSAAEVRRLALRIGRFLVAQDVKLMVVACNTATAAALPALQAALPIPVIGVIKPGVKAALAEEPHAAIGVIATTATTKAQAYEHELHRQAPEVRVQAQAAQALVSVVEHHQTGTAAAQAAVNAALAPYQTQPVDALILGCTHFPFLAPEIRRCLGPAVRLVDPAAETVAAVANELTVHDQLNPAGGALRLCTTGQLSDLQEGAKQWLPLLPAATTYETLTLPMEADQAERG